MADMRAKGADTDVLKRHNLSLTFPEHRERPLIFLAQAWELYAAEYQRLHNNASVCLDPAMGPAWLAIANAMLTMLNGEIGRLDKATMSEFIRETSAEHGAET